MDAGIKARWLLALRSGKFTQGRHHLKTMEPSGPTHCCLGVLCEILEVKQHLRDVSHGEKPMPGDLWAFGDDEHGFGNVEYLPESVTEQASLNRTEQTKLATMNDGGSSFTEIADYIERTY